MLLQTITYVLNDAVIMMYSNIHRTTEVVRNNYKCCSTTVVSKPRFCSTWSPFSTWLSPRTQSGRRSSFGKWVWFTESNTVSVISFYLLYYLLNLFLI